MYDRKGIASNPTETTRLLQNSLQTAQETAELSRLTNLELQRQEEQLNEAIENVSHLILLTDFLFNECFLLGFFYLFCRHKECDQL